jgi:ParB family chromosome partitioning protein
MKKISHAAVMVEDIQSSLPRTDFSETELDEAARLLLKIEGVITPPILLQSGVDSYRVIEGDFEYYAAKRAGEIDPLKGETINAYIAESEEDVAVYQKQIEVFRQRKSLPQPSQSQPVLKPSDVSHEARIVALEKMLPDAIKHLGDQITALSEQIKTLQASLTMPISPPVKPPVQTATPATEKPVQATTAIIASSPEEQKFLEELNTLPIIELNSKLERIKTRNNVREKIIKERQNPSFQPFQSRHDIFKRRIGIRQKTFDKMLENYNNLT